MYNDKVRNGIIKEDSRYIDSIKKNLKYLKNWYDRIYVIYVRTYDMV